MSHSEHNSRRLLGQASSQPRSATEAKSSPRSTPQFPRKQEHDSPFRSQPNSSPTSVALTAGKLIMTSSELKRRNSCNPDVRRKDQITTRVTTTNSLNNTNDINDSRVTGFSDRDVVRQHATAESSSSDALTKGRVSKRISFLDNTQARTTSIDPASTTQKPHSVTLISQTVPLSSVDQSNLFSCKSKNNMEATDEPLPFVRLHNPLRRTLPASLGKAKARSPVTVRPYRYSKHYFDESEHTDLTQTVSSDNSQLQPQYDDNRSLSDDEMGSGLFRRSQSMRVSDLIQRFDRDKYQKKSEKSASERAETKHSSIKRCRRNDMELESAIDNNAFLTPSNIPFYDHAKINNNTTIFRVPSHDVQIAQDQGARTLAHSKSTSNRELKDSGNAIDRDNLWGVNISKTTNTTGSESKDCSSGNNNSLETGSYGKGGFLAKTHTQNLSNDLDGNIVSNINSTSIPHFVLLGQAQHIVKPNTHCTDESGDGKRQHGPQESDLVSKSVRWRRHIFETAIQKHNENIHNNKSNGSEEVKLVMRDSRQRTLKRQENATEQADSAQVVLTNAACLESSESVCKTNFDAQSSSLQEAVADSYLNYEHPSLGIYHSTAVAQRADERHPCVHLHSKYGNDCETSAPSKVDAVGSPEPNINLEDLNKTIGENERCSSTIGLGKGQHTFDEEGRNSRVGLLPLSLVDNNDAPGESELTEPTEVEQPHNIADHGVLKTRFPLQALSQCSCTSIKVREKKNTVSEKLHISQSFGNEISSFETSSNVNKDEVKDGNTGILKEYRDMDNLNLHPDYQIKGNLTDVSIVHENKDLKSDTLLHSSELFNSHFHKLDSYMISKRKQASRQTSSLDSESTYNNTKQSLQKENAPMVKNEGTLPELSTGRCVANSQSTEDEREAEKTPGERIQSALDSLRLELKSLREQDVSLLRQLIAISETIQRIQRSKALRVSKSLSFSSGLLCSNNNTIHSSVSACATRNCSFDKQTHNYNLTITTNINNITNNTNSCRDMYFSCRDVATHQFQYSHPAVCDSNIHNFTTSICGSEDNRKNIRCSSCSNAVYNPLPFHGRPLDGGSRSLALLTRQMSSPSSSVETRRHNWLFGSCFLSSTDSSISSFDFTGDLSSANELEESTGSLHSLFASAPAISQTQPRLNSTSATGMGTLLRMPDLRFAHDITENESQSYEDILWRNVKLWKLNCQERSVLV